MATVTVIEKTTNDTHLILTKVMEMLLVGGNLNSRMVLLRPLIQQTY